MSNESRTPQSHLAWHETLELHELIAFQSNALMEFKMNAANVKDPALHALYEETVKALETNLQELLPYLPKAPVATRVDNGADLTAFYAAHLLIFAKTSVRNYAVAITETATPQLRDLLQKQLNNAILLHGKAYAFMLERGLYPSYDLAKLLANDAMVAKKALSL
ncbi:spore coat protein [Paenibacillus xanthanilyticus]|uniref:Spore coat protein n=1 Tax=Paenibacillus xanthanilyticus TaxID=1783531 RepID=A0ABV8JY24_9BACL